MSDADAEALRRTARRTWRFFETFVTPADNMLPPDNFQDNPAPAIAHRTSPTNLGLYLLSVVSARDFGWIGTDRAIDRIEATLATMSGLQRFRGHFYNWYDTRDLRPLDPRYVSTVDSGNLAGHLIALANACREWKARPLAAQRRLDGVADALEITRAESVRLRDGGQTQTVTLSQLDDAVAAVALALRRRGFRTTILPRDWRVSSAEAEIMVDIAGRWRSNAATAAAPICCSGRKRL
jgi:cyclic beta-1,2-glucan synthetase